MGFRVRLVHNWHATVAGRTRTEVLGHASTLKSKYDHLLLQNINSPMRYSKLASSITTSLGFQATREYLLLVALSLWRVSMSLEKPVVSCLVVCDCVSELLNDFHIIFAFYSRVRYRWSKSHLGLQCEICFSFRLKQPLNEFSESINSLLLYLKVK